VHALCRVQALLTSGILRMGELAVKSSVSSLSVPILIRLRFFWLSLESVKEKLRSGEMQVSGDQWPVFLYHYIIDITMRSLE
jgi:hypothetical protein